MAPHPRAPAAAAAGRPERLVAAARDLANETGTAAFTVAQVAQRAGLSLKAFYRCFCGKDDLLVALLAEESVTGAAALRDVSAKRADPLRAFVDELFALATLPESAGYAGVLVREHRRLSEVRPEEIRTALGPMTDVLAACVPTSDPQRDAQTMFGVLLGGMHEVLLGRVDDVDELTDYLYGFCARGLDVSR
ncbi:MAG: TetR/AcrR family transcriptional regulator [Acidimicrobiia bacterium]